MQWIKRDKGEVLPNYILSFLKVSHGILEMSAILR